MAGPGSRLTRFPLSAAIDLHEIHLARQSSLQVPVGHIPVPGGIKLCSPGTFWVANYLIINNSSCQVNFMKPNRATIRYTNSQWLREDPTEAPVGKVAVKNPVVNPTLTRQQYRFPSLRHATVPQKYLWAGWPCRRPVRSPPRHAGMALEYLWAGWPCRRPVRRPPSPRRDATEVLVGRVAVPKQIVRRIIMIEVKVLVGYAPWQMVSGGIGSRKEGAHEVGRTSRHHLSRSNHGPAISPA